MSLDLRKRLHTVETDCDGLRALRMMRQNQVHHLAVTKHGKLVGVVSDRNILAAALLGDHGQEIVWLPVKSAVQLAPVLSEKTSLGEIVEFFRMRNCDAALIKNAEEQVVGIITQSDLLKVFYDDVTAKFEKRAKYDPTEGSQDRALPDKDGSIGGTLGRSINPYLAQPVVQRVMDTLASAGI